MESLLVNLAVILGSYLIGSIPTGLILSRIFARIDIREYGSHNIGATNVYRNLGKKLGALTLLGDILKGFLPVYLVYRITGADVWISCAALAAFWGHLFPIYLKFSGGKGVATGFGIFLFLAPKVLPISFLIFILVLLLFRFVSLSSMCAAVSLPFLMTLSPHPYPKLYCVTAFMIAILIIYRHKENIIRIIRGEEHKIKGRN